MIVIWKYPISGYYTINFSFALEEGVPVQPGNLFSPTLRDYSPVQEYHWLMSDSGHVRYFRGVALAGNLEGRAEQ